MKMPTVMRQQKFARTPVANIPRSVFDRSHKYATTFDQGFLIPVLCDWVFPGDTINCRMTAFARLATPSKPLMDNMYLDSFFFFIPNRLVWDNWTKFMGEQEDPGDSIAYTIPQTTIVAGYSTGHLGDYFGLPVGVAAGSPAWTHSALPIRGYFRVWNEWFRDENLQDSVSEDGTSGTSPNYGNGPDAQSVWPLNRGKRHDYFTSCLPWQQKGTAVSLVGDVISDDTTPQLYGVTSSSLGTLAANTVGGVLRATTGAWTVGEDVRFNSSNTGLTIDTNTINEFREAYQIQRLLERSARSGTRYPEVIRSVFGVTDPSHLVLQRTEYLGGGSTPLNMNTVSQGGADASGTPTAGKGRTGVFGEVGGVGTFVASRHGFVKSFTEHGIVLGLVSVRLDLSYHQGLQREWSWETRYDFYVPDLAHLGEQAVLNQEIYIQGAAADASAFGYQERWAEMRYKPSRVTGQFRSNTSGGPTTLDVWHLAEDFAALPTLNSTFIEDNLRATVDRVILIPSEPHFFFDAWFDYRCARPMPVYSVPGLVERL